ILDNAIKFANEGGELGIDIAEASGVLQIKISNEGPEIPEADRERIFNKFYQTDKTHSQYGNGIGLSIVKRIVELHDGTVSAGRENDKTVFTVSIPL
ncbi:MAG: ATP-binding protein, partial [Clostridiales bacterium]|nr:ATP-binding protein [Clostridiales bacterium]